MKSSSKAAARKSPPSVPGWNRRGQTLRRTLEFADFAAAMKFVNSVARQAEKIQHHPDIDIRWNRVALALTTHDAGGLTDKDYSFAEWANARTAILQKA